MCYRWTNAPFQSMKGLTVTVPSLGVHPCSSPNDTTAVQLPDPASWTGVTAGVTDAQSDPGVAGDDFDGSPARGEGDDADASEFRRRPLGAGTASGRVSARRGPVSAIRWVLGYDWDMLDS